VLEKTQRRTNGKAQSTRFRPIPSALVAAVDLPTAELTAGKSVSESLRRRQTIREIKGDVLPLQLLSNLLWAACGINRPKGPFGTPGLTAASASKLRDASCRVLACAYLLLPFFFPPHAFPPPFPPR